VSCSDKDFLIDQNARTLLNSGPEILAAFQPFYLRNGYDPALKGKLLLLDMERPQVIFGRADPHELQKSKNKKINVFKSPRLVGAMGSPVSVGAVSSSSEEKDKESKVKLVKREDVKKEGKHARDRDSSASTGGKVDRDRDRGEKDRDRDRKRDSDSKRDRDRRRDEDKRDTSAGRKKRS